LLSLSFGLFAIGRGLRCANSGDRKMIHLIAFGVIALTALTVA